MDIGLPLSGSKFTCDIPGGQECIGGGYTEPPLAVASIPVDRCESHVDIESPLYSHIKEDPVYLYRVLLDRVHLRLIPPSNIKRAALPERGLLHRPCTGEGGQRDRVSTDPHNQLLYTPPNPYTQATTSKGDRKSELCWIQQINLIIILALFLHIFRI